MIEQSTNPIGKLPKWQQIAIFFIALLAGIAALDWAKSAYAERSKPARLTFTASVQHMIDRYNSFAAKMDRSLLLPPANAMEDGGSNEKFHVLRHAIKPNIYITIEVDNASGHPFSLNANAVPANNGELLSLIAVLPAIGATVFGKGDKAGIILKQCSKAIDEKSPYALARVEEFEVFCSNAMGLWMAGISVAKDGKITVAQ